MQIKKKKISSKILILVSLTSILLFGAAAYAIAKFNTPPTQTGPTREEKNTGEAIKENSIKPVSESDGSPAGNGSDPLPAPTQGDDGSKATVGMDITSVNQDENNLRIRVIIKTIANSGTCKLVMTHSSGLTYETSADVQALASSTTCKGFDISKNNLRSGSWDVSISYENDSTQSQTTKEIVLE